MSQGRPDAESATVHEPLPGEPLRLPGVLLTVVEGPDRGRTAVAQRGVVRVGSARDNDLVLSDDAVSRRHLEVRLRSDEVRVADMGSTNGTSVDGVRIVEAILGAGQLIRLGASAIRATAIEEQIAVPLSSSTRIGSLLGQSVAMREVFAILERVAPTDASVIVEGETGTGKELAAEAIHTLSQRAEGPFVAIDCGAIPATLIESELFGHVRGAFTGATGDRRGVFEEAHGGTLFLDEVGELPLDLQPKLLRALEKREIRRVGSTSTLKVDVRVVAATNRDLATSVNRGQFREDLYFRLAVVQVRLPPLRARMDDLPLLVRHFVECIAPDEVARVPGMVTALSGKPFPGNVRELRNAVQRTLALTRPIPGDPAPPTPPVAPRGLAPVDWNALMDRPYKEGLAELTDAFERDYLERLLRANGQSVSAAARAGGLSRRYVQILIQKHGLRGSSDG